MKKTLTPLFIIFFFVNNNVFGQGKINSIIDDIERANYIGGYEAFQKFIKENYKYPKKMCIEGTISFQLIVEKDSTASDIKILKGLSPECDAEAMRVIKLISKWQPARRRGQVLKNRITFPIKIKL